MCIDAGIILLHPSLAPGSPNPRRRDTRDTAKLKDAVDSALLMLEAINILGEEIHKVVKFGVAAGIDEPPGLPPVP